MHYTYFGLHTFSNMCSCFPAFLNFEDKKNGKGDVNMYIALIHTRINWTCKSLLSSFNTCDRAP